jgi:hypothetical protein
VEEVRRCLKATEQELSQIPQQVHDNPSRDVLDLWDTCEKKLVACINAVEGQKDLTADISNADNAFLKGLKSSMAQFGLVGGHENFGEGPSKTANEFLFPRGQGIEYYLC